MKMGRFFAWLAIAIGVIYFIVPLIGTFEMSGWSFQTGSYTDPNPAFAVNSRYGAAVELDGCAS